MVTGVIIIALVVAVCFCAAYQIARNCPEGYEDENGWHAGRQPAPKDGKK